MTKLADSVRVERRFARSARIDSDLNGTPPLTGYVLQASVRKSLESMLAGIVEAGQYAFTWTGPYGGGKSCAALLVANLVAGAKKQKTLANEIAGKDLARGFERAFPSRGGNWKVLALTGRRTALESALFDAASETFGWTADRRDRSLASASALIEELESEARNGGLLIVIDELGKFLEHAMTDGSDIHLLQDLAERAARSDGRVAVIGILHQSFEQYAGRLNRAARDEWAKVQGRYQNLPFLAQADEVAALIARAVIADEIPREAKTLSHLTAEAVAKRRPVDVASLSEVLSSAWPLHPVTTLLLGPVSRQRFAQNERSVFGFLSSAEPFGFQAHLAEAEFGSDAWYRPDMLWDYLVANFGSALAVGPEGNRMTLALEAVERASLRGGLAARLTKTAAIVELFRNGSGLAVGEDILRLSVSEEDRPSVGSALDDLVDRAILIRQARVNGFALFAGSDFDLDEALAKASVKLDADLLADLPARLGFGPIAAKKHYFKTGALRVFDMVVQFWEDTETDVGEWAARTATRLAKTKRVTSGQLILLIPHENAAAGGADRAARLLGEELESRGQLAGIAVAKNVYLLRENAGDLYALDKVETSYPQLEGDRIARRELAARRALVTDAVRHELLQAFSAASWWLMGRREKSLDGGPLTVVATQLSDAAFNEAPIIQSELLYRDRPSSSAMAGLRMLAHAMVSSPDVEDLGIDQYPAERGLYLTVLRPLGLHRQSADGVWRFSEPAGEGGSTLLPAWRVFSSEPKGIRLSQIYERWAQRPFGIKRGVMPILALAYMLANRASVAVYLDGYYLPQIDDVFVDRMMQDPSSIELRIVSRSKRENAFVQRLASLLSQNALAIEPEALPVASALFQRFKGLPVWTQRTGTLPSKTRAVRDIILKANDPEALLFSDLATALEAEPDAVVSVAEALLKCESAYPAMLQSLREMLAEQLGTDERTFEGIGPRAITASGVTADLRVDAFIMRAGAFSEIDGDIEGLASLLIHKPPRNWSDREYEQAVFELAKLCRRFREAETFAGVKNRAPTAQAISVVIGLDAKEKPLFHTFEVTDQELVEADRIAADLLSRLRSNGARTTVELAAIARIVEQLSGVPELESQ